MTYDATETQSRAVDRDQYSHRVVHIMKYVLPNALSERYLCSRVPETSHECEATVGN